ncbi:MAG: SAM-dependent methyltransferase [Prevotella sp.]|nr:SAM-dependent methyltransferase [Prevotella sp.]
MEISSQTQAFISLHRQDDVRQLALQASRYPEVDMTYALEQIAGWQAACRKLPAWASVEGLIYPPHLALEQCSSETTARYKADLIGRLTPEKGTIVDLTGGFGVDFSWMAKGFKRYVYVERHAHLCSIMSHNCRLLGLERAEIVNGESEEYLSDMPQADVAYLDPARRDRNGMRTYAIGDCTPNVLSMGSILAEKARFIVVKLSPMLDWHKAVDDLDKALSAYRSAESSAGTDSRQALTKKVSEVHIVSVKNECKELLLVVSSQREEEPLRVFCVNDEERFEYEAGKRSTSVDFLPEERLLSGAGSLVLYEPNASIMKAGCFDEIGDFYHLWPIAPSSHLFVGEKPSAEKGQGTSRFPGRVFDIQATSSMNRQDLKQSMTGIRQANVAVRNFPMSAEQLRKRLKVSDGGDVYVFGTTLQNGRHILIICKKTA